MKIQSMFLLILCSMIMTGRGEAKEAIAPETKSEKLNSYGDQFVQISAGYGIDISSQRQDLLDLRCLKDINHRILSGYKTYVLDLGGGAGHHSLNMALLGAKVTMCDLSDQANTLFSQAVLSGIVKPDQLVLKQKNFLELSSSDIPEQLDILYSQRAIHYLPYSEAKRLLGWLFHRLSDGGTIYISAAGWNTEYGLSYPDRNKKIQERFATLSPEMQKKHGIYHPIVTYKEEELGLLLEEIGFSKIQVTSSTFGNIKAFGRKD